MIYAWCKHDTSVIQANTVTFFITYLLSIFTVNFGNACKNRKFASSCNFVIFEQCCHILVHAWDDELCCIVARNDERKTRDKCLHCEVRNCSVFVRDKSEHNQYFGPQHYDQWIRTPIMVPKNSKSFFLIKIRFKYHFFFASSPWQISPKMTVLSQLKHCNKHMILLCTCNTTPMLLSKQPLHFSDNIFSAT